MRKLKSVRCIDELSTRDQLKLFNKLMKIRKYAEREIHFSSVQTDVYQRNSRNERNFGTLLRYREYHINILQKVENLQGKLINPSKTNISDVESLIDLLGTKLSATRTWKYLINTRDTEPLEKV